MEINRFEEVLGGVAVQSLVEGRFVILVDNIAGSHNFGSREDLPGARVPETAEESKRARFCVTWPVDNRSMPIYNPTPAMDFSMRKGGFDQQENVPFDAEVWLTYPGYQVSKTIPSGNLVLCFGTGSYTLPSGQFIDNVALHVPGAPVIVANTTEDTTNAGKLKYQATMDERVVGIVERFDATDYSLTVRIK
jgi:hypothetical protein